MNKVVQDAASLAAAGVGALRKAGSAVLRAGATSDGADQRWRTVTINLPQEEVMPGGRLPQPLAEMGDRIEATVRSAPGGKGTELAARLRPVAAGANGKADGQSNGSRSNGGTSADGEANGEDPVQELRSALRRAKQILEVGEVLSVDGQPAGKRSPTPGGKLIESAAKRAGGEGLV